MRTITGTLRQVDGTPSKNTKITFTLVNRGNKPVATFSADTNERVFGQHSVKTNNLGQFSISLYENTKLIDETYYLVQVDSVVKSVNMSPFRVAIFEGVGSLDWLELKAAGSEITPAQLPILNEYILRAENSANSSEINLGKVLQASNISQQHAELASESAQIILDNKNNIDLIVNGLPNVSNVATNIDNINILAENLNASDFLYENITVWKGNFNTLLELPINAKNGWVAYVESIGQFVYKDGDWVLTVKDGKAYSVVVESTNGDVFRVGQTISTLLIAHVFLNGVEITDQIPASKFTWKRISRNENINNDNIWNEQYKSGYKQIEVTIDDIDDIATYHCYINN